MCSHSLAHMYLSIALGFEPYHFFRQYPFLIFLHYINIFTGETDLQCVPDRFESVEDYVRVFEPLLFEECRAQLYSTWEELTEGVSSNAHTMVRLRSIERRERGTKSNLCFLVYLSCNTTSTCGFFSLFCELTEV